jgi:O-antigen/teichoic acid export membrane protein
MTFTRRVVSGSAQLTIGNGLVRLISIVTMPILTDWLSPESYGVAALAGTIVSIGSVIALAGIDTVYLRVYHSTQPPSGSSAEHFCWRFSVLNSLVAAMLSGIAWHFLSGHSVDPAHYLAILVAAGTLFSVLCTMSQLRALLDGRHRTLAIVTVVTGALAAMASIGIAVWERGVLALLLPMLLGYLLPLLLLGAPRVADLSRPSRLSWGEGWELVKIGLAGVITAPMYWLLTSSDRWFLERFHGVNAVGVYSVGYSVSMVGMMIIGPVMAVWQPESAREYEADQVRARVTVGKLMSRLIALMGIIWLAVTAAGGDVVRWFANERFHAAAEYVPYIAGAVFFYGVLRLATTGLFMAKELKWAAFWWLIGGIVCMLLNFTLVPTLGGKGAAITQSISFGLITVGVFASAQSRFRVDLNWPRLAPVMLALFVAGIYLSPAWHRSAPVSLLMKLPVGIALAVGVAWVMAPDWCARGIYLLRRRALP